MMIYKILDSFDHYPGDFLIYLPHMDQRILTTVRRQLIVAAGFAVIGGMQTGAAAQASPPPGKEPPNIIVILADDIGYGDLNGYFGGEARTPNLDRMAREGMLFTDFHSNGPMCSPTRAALLTGRYQQRLGIETPVVGKAIELPENRGETTMAHYLGAAGYRTAIYGKWHLGVPPEGNPVHFGFDEFIGYFGGDLDYFSRISRSGEKDWWHNESLLEETGYVTDLITEHSVRFMEKNRDVPFFLYVSHLAIHFPWQGPEDDHLWARQEGGRYTGNEPGPRSKLGPHLPGDVPACLLRMIEELDNSVGRILTALVQLGLERNTLVFFTSDNGGYINYREDVWPAVGSNGFLRGQKRDVFEGGHRVPAVAWWPGTIPALSVCDQTAMTMDLLPTFLELVHIDMPVGDVHPVLDGVSLVPLFRKEALEPRTLFWRMNDAGAVRQGTWKLVIQSKDHATGLYNLAADIGEKQDLATEHPELVQELLEEFLRWEQDVETKENNPY